MTRILQLGMSGTAPFSGLRRVVAMCVFAALSSVLWSSGLAMGDDFVGHPFATTSQQHQCPAPAHLSPAGHCAHAPTSACCAPVDAAFAAMPGAPAVYDRSAVMLFVTRPFGPPIRPPSSLVA